MLAGTLRRASRRVASPLPLYYPCSRTALHSSAIRYDAPEQHPNPNSTQTISIAAAQTSHSSRTNPNPPITSKPKKSLFETLRESAKVYFLGAKQFAENAKVVGRLRKESPDGSKWTRAENALVHQTSNDVRKVLPFFLLLIILPESLPFLMMRGSDIFPSTCVTESQKRQKFARLAKIRMEISASIVQSIEAGGMVSPRQLLSDDFIKTVAKSQHAYFRLSDAPKVQLSMLCKLFGLSSWGFKYQLRNRLIRHSEFLEKDDLVRYEFVWANFSAPLTSVSAYILQGWSIVLVAHGSYFRERRSWP
ncbi:hypothetical protein BJ742DRAFT_805282 [Cladochytrium replicatum]|nr:hypothetical protein BJ742DRAFT_805282 [Cladochytrium replicatum]